MFFRVPELSGVLFKKYYINNKFLLLKLDHKNSIDVFMRSQSFKLFFFFKATCQVELNYIKIIQRYFVLFLFLIFLMFIYSGERAWPGEGHSERETENPKKALNCQCKAQQGAWTQEPWDHDLSRSWMLNWLSHPGAPRYFHLKPVLIFRKASSV